MSESLPTETSQRFIVEAREHMGAMAMALMALERGKDDPRFHVEQVLRSAHSIKGGAGFIGKRKIHELAHAMETAVESLRDGQLAPTPEAMDALLGALDHIAAMIDDLDQSEAADTTESLAKLLGLTQTPATVSAPATPACPRPLPQLPGPVVAQAGEFPLSDQVRATWQPGQAMLYGVKLDWFACESECGLGAIEVAHRIEAAGRVLEARTSLTGPPLAEGLPVAPLWYHAIIGSPLGLEEFAQRLDIPCAAVLSLDNMAQRVARPPATDTPSHKSPTSLRISVGLIDRMMELAGELALVRNQAVRSTDPANAPLRRLMRRLDAVTTELQGAALRLRMQPLGTVFDRFPRMVRDLARQLGKQIEIEISGSEVELDKTVLEILADPLIHLFRNSCDHGIEMPDVRVRAGKPATGRISLLARQDRGQIVVEVRDDGKGLDPDAIRRKAMQQGIKQKDEIAAWSERQLYDLILLSGFSTAAKVTDLSGRGVGMDVVKTNLEQVGGTIEIDSAVDRGTCFTLRLPLTLAIMPCLQVACGGARYAIPQRDIQEIVLTGGASGQGGGIRIEHSQDEEVLRLGCNVLPVVRLDDVLARRSPARPTAPPADAAPPAKREYIAILRVGAHRFGLVIDDVLQSEDIVVKPLHPLLRKLGVFVAATILGDGGIALILGSEGIARQAGILHRPATAHVLPPPTDVADSHTWLLFRYGPVELLALPLAQVQRVVRVRTDRIERVGDRELIQIAGAPVSLLRLDTILNLSACPGVEWFNVILPRQGAGVGLAASQIVDTPTLPLHPDSQAYKVDGVHGSAIVAGQIAVLLDLDRLLRIWAGVRGTPAALLPAGAGRRILIVEDTQFFQRLITTTLESEGFTAMLAVHGVDALEKLQSEAFDLIISDIEMPVMDGFNLARRVRADQRFAGIPMLALTTLSDAASRAKAAACGFDAFEVKLERNSLLAKVRELLSASRSRPPAALTGGNADA